MGQDGIHDRRAPGSTPSPESSDTPRDVVDRRILPDRRAMARRAAGDNPGGPTAANTGLERRRGPGRRLSDFTRSAEEGEMTQEQFLFLMAINEFKKANARTFPSWTDVLEVIRLLGYRKTMPSDLKLRCAEDWREAPDTPANVRPKGWDQRAA
ncbi:MAG: hypothetical protein IT436_00610 [Phycisphaerales bacterium]|nr:hypothetical protein [Phycisphaerales bacterium]